MEGYLFQSFSTYPGGKVTDPLNPIETTAIMEDLLSPLFGSEKDDLAMAHGPHVAFVQGRHTQKAIGGATCLGTPGCAVIEKDHAAIAHGPHVAFVQGRHAQKGAVVPLAWAVQEVPS